MAKRSRVIGYAIEHTNGSITVKEFSKMRKSKRKGKKRATKKQLAALRKARAAMCSIRSYRKRRSPKKSRKGRKRKATPAQMRALRKAWAARRRQGRRR